MFSFIHCIWRSRTGCTRKLKGPKNDYGSIGLAPKWRSRFWITALMYAFELLSNNHFTRSFSCITSGTRFTSQFFHLCVGPFFYDDEYVWSVEGDAIRRIVDCCPLQRLDATPNVPLPLLERFITVPRFLTVRKFPCRWGTLFPGVLSCPVVMENAGNFPFTSLLLLLAKFWVGPIFVVIVGKRSSICAGGEERMLPIPKRWVWPAQILRSCPFCFFCLVRTAWQDRNIVAGSC